MLYSVGITLSCFLFLLLILKKNKSTADQILATWLILMTIHQFLFYLHYADLVYQFPHALGLALPLPVLHGLFLYFYVGEITQTYSFNSKKLTIHLLPFLTLVILAIPFYRLPGAEKIYIFKNKGKGYEWYSLIQLILIMVSGLTYVLISLRLIYQFRKKIQNQLSNIDRKTLEWLQYLSIGLGLIWMTALFFDDRIIFTGVVILVVFIGFYGINQTPIFYIHKNNNSQILSTEFLTTPSITNSSDIKKCVRYAKSGLKDEEANKLLNQLDELMIKEKLYKNNELTLRELANRLDIHPNYLSQTINEYKQKNFYHYINTLRIKEFIHLASQSENKKYTLLSLALDCGFNSKSTFNKYFKLYTGTNPSLFFKL